jgi:4-amino-4-deoxy-L-arabinose transferase-like glycosyltransferase
VVVSVAPVVALMALGFAARLALGLRTQLDADEATLALAGLHISQGHLVLMEPNAQYLGALDSYVSAPFIALLGPNLLAIRAATATVGAAYVLSMYALGRVIFGSHRAALLLALIAAVFPLFAVSWGAKLRDHAELLGLEAASLALAGLAGWTARRTHLVWWSALGFVVGVAMWNDVSFAIVAAVIAMALLIRGPAIHWATTLRGGVAAAAGAVIGFAPWLVFNARHHFLSLAALPAPHISYKTGLSNLLSEQLPILVGGTRACGNDVVPTWVSDGAIAIVVLGVLWLRRQTIVSVATGHLTKFTPLDLTLAVAPAVVILSVLSRTNYVTCEPRYQLPLAIPLAVGLATILLVKMPWRAVFALAAGSWLVISGIAASGLLVEMRSGTPTGGVVPFDLSAGLSLINQQHPQAVWAQYWLARPLSYYSGDTLVVGEFGGYVGFPERQAQALAAVRPDWVFAAPDTQIDDFERACQKRGVTFVKTEGGGLVLFSHLSARLQPQDVFGPA